MADDKISSQRKKKPAAKKPIKWSRQVKDAWIADVVSWPWREIEPDEHWQKAGDCPRCGDPITVNMRKGPTLYTVDRDPIEVYAECACGIDHPERPEDVPSGCGFRANIPGPEGVR